MPWSNSICWPPTVNDFHVAGKAMLSALPMGQQKPFGIFITTPPRPRPRLAASNSWNASTSTLPAPRAALA